MFTIASWNVNSLKVRLPQVQAWLESQQPDVLALQETKMQDIHFPVDALRNANWHVMFAGQKTFNGVAIISKQPAILKATELPSYADAQRRVLGVEIGHLFILNLYVPNGQAVGSPKYQYKLEWLSALRHYVQELLERYSDVIVLGDFNIAPTDLDVYDPLAWEGEVLVSPQEREQWQDLINLGLVDAFRGLHHHQEFSWWDYRQASFRRNHGLRIDHILTSKSLLPHLAACWIDKQPRSLTCPSDHAPIIAQFAL